MTPIFVDAGYWIALFHPHDQLHHRAIAASRDLKGRALITSELILVEFLDHFASCGQHLRLQAVEVMKSFRRAPDLEIIAFEREQFDRALELYETRPDKAWSLTDCVSFLIMQERGITEALAHDEHFKQAGFVALLRG